MNKLHHPSNHQKYSHHNSVLCEKLLHEQHLISENSYRQSQSHQQQYAAEQSEKVEMVIEFGGSNNASILAAPHDQPTTLVKRFCFKRNIGSRIITTLAARIKNMQMSTFNLHKHKQPSYRIDKNQTVRMTNRMGTSPTSTRETKKSGQNNINHQDKKMSQQKCPIQLQLV